MNYGATNLNGGARARLGSRVDQLSGICERRGGIEIAAGGALRAGTAPSRI